jgi:putative FmdB family regulatory protein
MPIYEYRCQSCGHELEKLQRMSDPALTDCPACGKSRLRRLVSAAGFRLKGSGWYETDFKQGNKRNVADSDGPKPDAPATKDSTTDAAGSTAAKSKESQGGAAGTA